MTLLLDHASFPVPMWVITRALLFIRRPLAVDEARALLTPEALPEESETKRKTFDRAVNTLEEYGMLNVESGLLTLTPAASKIPVDNYAAFCDHLRVAMLSANRNSGLGTGTDGGPREFVRALCWFLGRSPLADPLNYELAEAEAGPGAFPSLPDIPPFKNDTRWNRFQHWALALGFAEIAVTGADNRLIPDCTRAVGRVIRGLWPVGEQIDSHELLVTVLRKLPVLPGGEFSRTLGLGPPEPDRMSPALSFALLSAITDDRDWLELRAAADAPRDVFAIDPDAPGGVRRITYVVVKEGLDG